MALRDLNDAWGWVQKIIRRIERLESGAMLENSSITNGRMRFIGGLLRVDSGGSVEIVGTLAIDGTTTVTGSFTVTGPWGLEGDGTITGDVTITGNVTSTGTFTQNGPWNLNGLGKIAGDTDLTGALSVNDGGKITVEGTGGDVVIDSSYSDPRILLGGANINGGTALTFTTGESPGSLMILYEQTLRIPSMPSKTSLDGLSWLAIDALGKFWKVDPAVGGPGRPLRWPFPSSMVTDEFGPRPSPGPGGSTDHEGIDLAPGAGAPIPAAGSGTVELAGDNGGFGFCVIINHGGGLKTLYAHMQAMPSVSVGAIVTSGQIIGLVGNTGTSFGAHLHFEVHVNGVPVNPRTKLPTS